MMFHFRKKFLTGMLVASMALGLNTGLAGAANKDIPYPAGSDVSIEGPASVLGTADHAKSAYFAHPDIYNMKSNNNRYVLTHYPVYQQTTEYTCGPAAALTICYWYGDKSQSEASLKKLMNTRSCSTSLKDMVEGFRQLGWQVDSTLNSHTPLTAKDFKNWVVHYMKEGRPILVKNVQQGGHWRVIIGYDTMGTDTLLDDVLIFQEPYDTYDHLQDGYSVENMECFFSMWFDNQVLPEGRQATPWVIAVPLQSNS